MSKSEAYLGTLITAGILGIVLIICFSLVRGCEEVQTTSRQEVQLKIEQVKAGYEYQKTQTNTTKVGPGQRVDQTSDQAQPQK